MSSNVSLNVSLNVIIYKFISSSLLTKQKEITARRTVSVLDNAK